MQPNIVVVLTDDHARWASGCYGNSELRTPTLDHLARSGVQLTNAFTPTPVCSPARASFWTGRMPSQHGVHDYLADIDPEVNATPWLAGQTTLADLLSAAGYVTGLSGKWHVGAPETRPSGFDYWYSVSGPVAGAQAYEAPWPISPSDDVRYNPHAITDHAVEFLRNRPSGQPFFLFTGYIATHSPWSGHPERLVDSYRGSTFADIPDDTTYPFGRLAGEAVFPTRHEPREALAQYYASVSEIDEQVGRILDELDAQDATGDTLVVYTSDHGMNTGHHGLWGKGNATRPYNMLEESIRIPMILHHPGHLLGGQRRSEMVTHCDLFATIVEHAGIEDLIPVSDRASLPGRSFRDLCRGVSDATWPEYVVGEYGDLRMIRSRTHKLLTCPRSNRLELFDLVVDPRETTNVASEPANASLVADLRERLVQFFATFSEPAYDGLKVDQLPRHNDTEDWRDTSDHVLVSEATWIDQLSR